MQTNSCIDRLQQPSDSKRRFAFGGLCARSASSPADGSIEHARCPPCIRSMRAWLSGLPFDAPKKALAGSVSSLTSSCNHPLFLLHPPRKEVMEQSHASLWWRRLIPGALSRSCLEVEVSILLLSTTSEWFLPKVQEIAKDVSPSSIRRIRREPRPFPCVLEPQTPFGGRRRTAYVCVTYAMDVFLVPRRSKWIPTCFQA